MRSVNKVILVGNLTRDPQIKSTPNGQTIATFGLATNRTWVTTDGEQKNSTEFHELVVWSKLAEIAANTLRTGKLIYVEGYLKTRSWDQEDGTKKYKTEVVVEDLIILSKRESEEHSPLPEADSTLESENFIQDDNLF
jgi:single-strand DNA-binding protein